MSNFNQFSKMYRIMAQAALEYRLDAHALDNMFIRALSFNIVLLSQKACHVASSLCFFFLGYFLMFYSFVIIYAMIEFRD